ncbi:MAG: extracellular solute-binding protein [Oscillospiraceae bacterium]|nr:extracellular solute-binding protein [Oscillospiraceae bacterium]
MMKKVLALLLVCVSVFSLVACHGKRQNPEFVMPETFDAEKQHEITFWAKNDTNVHQVQVYEKAIEDFEALYPNVKVQLRLYTDYGVIYNDVITNIATNTTPNVCITYPDHIATYITGTNCVVPLDVLMNDPSYGLGGSALAFDGPTKEELVPQFLEECKIGDTYFALPFMRSTEACYVNATYLEKLGYTLPEVLTWDFVWEVSEAAAKKDEEGTYLLNGQKVLLPFIYKSTDNMMIQYLRQCGAGYSTDAGDVEIFNETTNAFLADIAKHVEAGAFSTFKIAGYPANFLNAGQCVFAVDSTAGATWMGSDAPLIDISEDRLVDFEIAVLPIPQIDPENPVMISQGPSVCVFNKEDPQEVLASWLFTQFLLTNDVQIGYSSTEGYAPVTLKAQQDEKYTTYIANRGVDNDEHYSVKIDATNLLTKYTENTFVTPVFNGSTSLRNAAGQMIENVTKSVKRKQTVDDAYLEKLQQEVTALYRLDQLSAGSVGQGSLGKLPTEAVALLGVLGAVWVFLALYFVIGQLRAKRRKNGKNS